MTRIVGLTGGIGSGKSTVAAMLRERGATVLDADAIVREIQAPGGEARAINATPAPAAEPADGRV